MRIRDALLLASMAACGTETGNPEGLVDVGYNARSSAPDVVGIAVDAPVRVDAAWVRIDRAHVDPCEADAVDVPSIGLGDHSGPEAVWQELTLPLVPVCGVRLDLTVTDGAGDPAGVDGAAVALQGVLDDARAFTVRWGEARTLSRTLPSVTPEEGDAWLFTFDLATWVDVDALAVPGDPVDVAGDPAALEAGLSLHLDVDGDGTVGPDDVRLD